MAIDWKRFCDIIHSHHTFLVTSHIRPDCDALGSALGMALVLESLGKQVRIVTGDPVPPNLAFIDPEQRIEHLGGDVTLDQLSEIEVMMVLDTSAWAQLGPMGDVLRADRKIKMVLDHHVSEDDLGAAYFKNTTAEATGRLVAEAASELGVPLTAEIATPLFAAQATDTGWYRFKSTTGDALRVAASFVDAGAIPQEIYSDIYEQDTLGRLRLRGIVLARTETDLDGRMAHTFLRLTDFEQSGAVPSDTEDLINLTLAIKGVEFAVILVEQDAGDFKLSFRSRCGVDCSRLAQQFGGGGHKAAAGAGIDGPFEDAQPKVLKAVREAMEAVV
ncbi:MAG: DHH family phosphoesterase [Planctomycetota bacterium]|nr:DHH family phosphoesterase [Planctomycetota bacterium]